MFNYNQKRYSIIFFGYINSNIMVQRKYKKEDNQDYNKFRKFRDGPFIRFCFRI